MKARVVVLSIGMVASSYCQTEIQTDDALLLQLLHEHTKVNTRQPWRPVQEEVRDTVVQIFSQIAKIDLLQPYKTPEQLGARGSGFFINNEGDIVTNAHVIDQAVAIWIQIPSFGKRLFDVTLVGMCPKRDVAIVRLNPESLAFVRAQLGELPYLTLGDSDLIRRADEVLALGYPLGQESLKSTTGVISGREDNVIQMSAPINPGSSGGPLLNVKGEVVGINSSGFTEAQNVGYIIPINDLKVLMPDLYKTTLVRKPYLGITLLNATESLTTFLGNPHPGGAFIVDVVKDSLTHKAGLRAGDMIYQINGFDLDMYSDMKAPWSEDKISLESYISRLAIGEVIDCVYYRAGERLTCTIPFEYSEPAAVHRIYPGYDALNYEVGAGMVVMELTLNHIRLLAKQAPGLLRYAESTYQCEPTLIITHIFPNCQLFRSRTLQMGMTLIEVNGKPVHTLADYRAALQESVTSGYLTMKAYDSITRGSDNLFVVLPFATIKAEELLLAKTFHFPVSEFFRQTLS
ncbi:MAG TPA: trypsin-like peptidase domain-containing protein [Candidatus Limnocylindria bacterium]|nr:trypsin-like peptidase domain-containing protein [Candidatus Limnocylindria bacterium]